MAETREQEQRRIVEECFRREAGEEISVPNDETDLLAKGILDSMGWAGFLRGVESACGAPDLGARLVERPASLAAVLAALSENVAAPLYTERGEAVYPERSASGLHTSAAVCSSGVALGSRRVEAEEVDQAFGMPEGKLRNRAGIESVAYAAPGEDELTLGATAAQQALAEAGCTATAADWIVATSETHHSYPSLGALLHSRLLLREDCGVLDVGGACLGLLNALAAGQSLLESGRARHVLIVTADVHSRVLMPGRVAGEFGGLFGDGASAFLLRAGTVSGEVGGFRLGEFFFGCAGQYANAIRVSDAHDGTLAVQFDGEALSRAAITRMEKVLAEVELRSGIPRSSVNFFATHQPNPRLVALLAKQCGVSAKTFPPVARTAGNLGSTTCGAALHLALQSLAKLESGKEQVVFLASLGPGLLYGGGWLCRGERYSEGGGKS